MCIITFITFQYVIIPKSSVIKCKDLRCTAVAQNMKKVLFEHGFIVVTVIEDYSKFSQISCPAPKLVPNHHNWQRRARPSLYTEWPFGNNDHPEFINSVSKLSLRIILLLLCSQSSVQYLTGRACLGPWWFLYQLTRAHSKSRITINHLLWINQLQAATPGDRPGKWRAHNWRHVTSRVTQSTWQRRDTGSRDTISRIPSTLSPTLSDTRQVSRYTLQAAHLNTIKVCPNPN